MVKSEKLTTKKILEAIKNSAGVKSGIAKKLGVHRHTIDRYQKKYPTIAQALKDEMDKVLDKAESNLFIRIQEGDIDVSKWILARRGRSRGYSDKMDIEEKKTDSQTIVVRYEDE